MLGVLIRVAFRRGVLGGSRRWLAIGAAALGLRVLRTYVLGRPEVVFREELAPGRVLRITTRRVP